jgi:hypothetical protein
MSYDILKIVTGKRSDELSDEELIQLAKGRGKYTDTYGYIRILQPAHHRADNKGYVGEHILVLENKLGRFLLDGEVPHHRDGNPGNNCPENLELFSSVDLHRSHHEGMRAVRECGNSYWRQCCYCHQWDDPVNMVIYFRSARHKECAKKHNEKRYSNRRLPRKEAALLACGHADWRKCRYCKEYDDAKNLYVSPDKKYSYHKLCHAKYQLERKGCAKRKPAAQAW